MSATAAEREQIRREIAGRAKEIEDMWPDEIRVTILARNADHPDGSRDVLVTNDDGDIVCAIRRRIEAEP